MTLGELAEYEINVPSILEIDGTQIIVLQNQTTFYNMVRANCKVCMERFERARLLHEDLYDAIEQILRVMEKHNVEEHA